ncbi:MAG: PH domain-containing protein [Leucobacter sp.]
MNEQLMDEQPGNERPSSEQILSDTEPDWHRVSPKYAVADLVINLVTSLVPLVVLVVLWVVRDGDLAPWLSIGLAALVVLFVVNSLFSFRRVKAIGYVLREDDLLFRRGIMFERIVAVPYGRLQLVDVNRGPLLRALGLSTLKFVTAAVVTGVQLPGLTREDAEALRDRLIELAESRRSGL